MPDTTSIARQGYSTPSLQEQAYKALLDRIVYLDYPPGTKLVIKTLCEELGMGRTPIRESLVRLGQQGIVYTVPQSGTFVSRIDLTAAEDSRFAREHLERRVAIACCARIDSAGFDELRRIIDFQVDAAERRDRRAFFDSDNNFHRTLFSIAERMGVWELLEQGNAHLKRYRWLRVLVKDLRWEHIVQQHCQIFEALKSRDPDEVDHCISVHLHLMLREKPAVTGAFPDYFTTTANRGAPSTNR